MADIPPIWFRIAPLLAEGKDGEVYKIRLGLPDTCLLPAERAYQLKRQSIYPCDGCKHDRTICGGRV